MFDDQTKDELQKAIDQLAKVAAEKEIFFVCGVSQAEENEEFALMFASNLRKDANAPDKLWVAAGILVSDGLDDGPGRGETVH